MNLPSTPAQCLADTVSGKLLLITSYSLDSFCVETASRKSRCAIGAPCSSGFAPAGDAIQRKECSDIRHASAVEWTHGLQPTGHQTGL